MFLGLLLWFYLCGFQHEQLGVMGVFGGGRIGFFMLECWRIHCSEGASGWTFVISGMVSQWVYGFTGCSLGVILLDGFV